MRDPQTMRSIVDMLIPPCCVFCGDDEERKTICARCLDLLPRIAERCERCGQPLGSGQPAGVTCASCQKRLPLYTRARAPLHYRFPVDTALKAMKFRGQMSYLPAFAELLLPLLQTDFAETDALVAVPLHRWRHAKRGFNQAAELCRELAKKSALPIFGGAVRTRATQVQSGLSSAKRRKNLKGAFAIKTHLNARYPLIVDDVMTTGATCEHLARVLIDAGADRVGVLTVARSSIN